MHYYFLTGASQGLGRALAEAILTRTDTQVIGISRHSTIAHPRYLHHPLDLSDLEAVRHNVAKLFPAYPLAQSLTLINNAGTLGQIGYVGEVPNEHFQFVFDLNVTAPAMLMNTFLRAYNDQTHLGRTLLSISSGAAQRPIDGWAAYSASKAALNALSETMQKEQTLRGSGVRIWALSPGIIDTAMQAHISTADAPQFSEHEKFAAFYAEGQLQAPATVAASIANWLTQAGQLPEQVVIKLPDLPNK